MGQSASSGSRDLDSSRYFSSEREMIRSYNTFAVKQLTAPELVSFKGNIGGKALDDAVTCTTMLNLLRISTKNEILANLLFNCFRTLSNFPLIKDSYDDITYIGLLKSCLLLHRQRCLKYVGNKAYNQVKLIFVSLAMNKSVKEVPSSPNPATALDSKKIIKDFDNVDVEDLGVPAESMLQLLTLLLRISKSCATSNCKFESDVDTNWESFKPYALNLLRTMNSEITNSQDAARHVITFEQFENTVTTVSPNLLNILECLMEHLLFLDRDLVEPQATMPATISSKLVNDPFLAQLATILPKELVYSKMQKLYVGRESGFSMRSFQSKAFKWMAPSILIISGMRIVNDTEYAMDKNPRYGKFLEEYPRLKDNDQQLIASHTGKRKFTFAVYIDEPWKVTNKEMFGNLKTTIVQLSPTQELFKAVRPENVYFNTVGGGIGIGCKQPVVKSSSKKYVPGNVSLTIDASLEFGVFRHVGHGGTINPGELLAKQREDNITFEHRFLIQDVEVWGCGGQKELEEQIKNWEWEEAEAKRRQRINLQSLNEDRALLELAGLVGQSQSGGSV